MYSVDVNLLKDRPGYRQDTTRSSMFGGFSQGPLVLGAAVGGGFLGLTLAALMVLTFLNQRLAAREQELEQQLSALAPDFGQAESLIGQEKQVKAETSALASVFNQVKPWSAMLQDIRDRVPRGLQITSIQQAAPAPSGSPAPSPSPSPSPAPGGSAPAAAPAAGLTIQGKALSFGDINDFVLALQNSPLLEGEATKLTQAQLEESTQATRPLATYQLQSDISDISASELLLELNRKGATGLVTRIQSLKEKGVLKP